MTKYVFIDYNSNLKGCKLLNSTNEKICIAYMHIAKEMKTTKLNVRLK